MLHPLRKFYLIWPILFFSCLNTYTPDRLFSIPVVVITFDDAHPSVYSFAFPTMRSMDTTWAATHFLPATLSQPGGTITVGQLQEMERAGWETGGHGYTHENLSSVPFDSIKNQVLESYTFLNKNGLCHESFAYAQGNYNQEVAEIVKEYFLNIRTSHDFEYLDGINRTELGYYAVKSGCTTEDIIARVERARSEGSPLVVIGFHAILPDSAPPIFMYWCREAVFTDFLKYLKKAEYPVMSVKKAMNLLCE